MFRMILFTQWKWSRLILLPAVIAAFALPVFSVQAVGTPNQSGWEARRILSAVQTWGIAYPLLATGIALAIAMTAWGADHRGRHVYALSLPLPRWNFALQRFGAGIVLLIAPALALWIGAEGQGAPSASRLRAKALHRLARKLREIDLVELQLDFAEAHAREVEQLAHEEGDPAHLTLEILRPLEHGVAGHLFVRPIQDTMQRLELELKCGDRRPQLVRGHGKELVARPDRHAEILDEL